MVECDRRARPWASPLVVHPAVEVEVRFQAVEKPAAEGAFELRFPRLGIPAPLVFGLFDQADIGIGLDQLDPPLDQPGDSRRANPAGSSVIGVDAMPLEPSGLSSPAAILRAITISNARCPAEAAAIGNASSDCSVFLCGFAALREIFFDQSVQAVALPVEFFLERRSSEPRIGHLAARQPSSRAREASCAPGMIREFQRGSSFVRVTRKLLRQVVEIPGQLEGTVRAQGT